MVRMSPMDWTSGIRDERIRATGRFAKDNDGQRWSQRDGTRHAWTGALRDQQGGDAAQFPVRSRASDDDPGEITHTRRGKRFGGGLDLPPGVQAHQATAPFLFAAADK